jgi:hypothetical protein
MNKDRVIANLALQVEYLKDKLEKIRSYGESIEEKSREATGQARVCINAVRIVNLCDDVEYYQDLYCWLWGHNIDFSNYKYNSSKRPYMVKYWCRHCKRYIEVIK